MSTCARCGRSQAGTGRLGTGPTTLTWAARVLVCSACAACADWPLCPGCDGCRRARYLEDLPMNPAPD